MKKIAISLVLLFANLCYAQGTIKHIVFILKENRSFDSYFGQFPGVTGGPITTAPCTGTNGGCSGGTMTLIAGNPTVGDGDNGHTHSNGVVSIDGGLMDKFNLGSVGTSWAVQYGATTIATYWAYATHFGLADHMFASIIGPSAPNHVYIIAAADNEMRDNPDMQGGSPPNGVAGGYNCDAFHYGRCVAGSNVNGLCSTNTDCPGSSCNIDSAVGACLGGSNAGGVCSTDAACPSSTCSNGNFYVGANPGLDLIGQPPVIMPTGTSFTAGVCTNHNTVPCTTLSYDTSCSSLGDTCNTAYAIASGRGVACQNGTTIFDQMDTAGVSWGYYISSSAQILWNAPAYIQHIRYGTDWTNFVHTDTQFAATAAGCTSDLTCQLPSVAWVSPGNTNSEHPANTVQTGQTWTATQVNAVMFNPYLWNNTVVFITWDDWGGFYDHLAPSVDRQSWRVGIRVPLICVSKYCKNQITHTTFYFESLLKCIEDTFSVSPINSIDAGANDVCTGSTGMVDLTLNNAPLVLTAGDAVSTGIGISAGVGVQ